MSNAVVLERFPTGAEIQSAATYGLPRRQRVYIFLTRYGLIFSVNLMVMLVGAVNYTNSLAYALTFLLGSLFLVGMLHTYSNLRGLIISAAPADPVFAGQQASFPLLFDNRPGKFRTAIDLQIQTRIRTRFRRKTTYLNSSTVDIAAQSMRSSSLMLDAVRRGYLVPGRIKISSTWPLGLFRAWSYMQIDQRCIVYPQPLGTSTLPAMTEIEEEEQSGKGTGTEDFIGFRQYQSGDSMRAVDWKAYARERGLISKRFSGKGTKKVLVDWQHTSHIDDIELRLSQLCQWIIAAENQQVQYALALPDSSDIHFACGDRHKHNCLQALAVYGLNNDQS